MWHLIPSCLLNVIISQIGYYSLLNEQKRLISWPAPNQAKHLHELLLCPLLLRLRTHGFKSSKNQENLIELWEMLESWTQNSFWAKNYTLLLAALVVTGDSSLPCSHSSVKTLKKARKASILKKITSDNNNMWPGTRGTFKWPLQDWQCKALRNQIWTCHFHRKLETC